MVVVVLVVVVVGVRFDVVGGRSRGSRDQATVIEDDVADAASQRTSTGVGIGAMPHAASTSRCGTSAEAHAPRKSALNFIAANAHAKHPCVVEQSQVASGNAPCAHCCCTAVVQGSSSILVAETPLTTAESTSNIGHILIPNMLQGTAKVASVFE